MQLFTVVAVICTLPDITVATCMTILSGPILIGIKKISKPQCPVESINKYEWQRTCSFATHLPWDKI